MNKELILTHNDLLVLGLLIDRPMHGYEILQHIQAVGIDLWWSVSPAAIYYSLTKLHRQGLVVEVRTHGEGPERSVYHITDKGLDAFFVRMEEALASQEPTRSDYDLGIFFLNKFPQERAIKFLERRLEFLRHREQELNEAQRQAQGDPLHYAILARNATCTRVEREWLEGIIRHLRGEEVFYGGLLILKGELRNFHLPDLIKLIASGHHSGTLYVTDGESIRSISFHEGRPVCATSQRPEGPIRDPEQILNDIYDLFRWQEGTFTFDQRVGPPEGCLILRMSAENLLLNGARWVDNWTIIQRVVPSSEAIFERVDGKGQQEDLVLTEEERRVWEFLDGTRTVAEVAQICNLTEFETSKIIYTLYVAGLSLPGSLDKVRLRRAFREFAELLCQATKPFRAGPEDFTCEEEVNKRAAALPIRFHRSRIEDHTDPSLRIEELARMYRLFLQIQQEVIRERFGKAILEGLIQQATKQINPPLKEVLQRYKVL
ncbi:MAG: DUF4388 domain-containing protein [Anaerolineae bacterium]|nr:DUF4388 domain-containing protein [Anaerolineae bacterium]MDW8101270.1 DUF4388 domain-containing protein [Anaerolineae bacterium]